MDKGIAANLQSAYIGLTITQRWCLKAIVEGRPFGLIEPVCEGLVDLGLLRKSGNQFLATDAGCYIATLF